MPLCIQKRENMCEGGRFTSQASFFCERIQTFSSTEVSTVKTCVIIDDNKPTKLHWNKSSHLQESNRVEQWQMQPRCHPKPLFNSLSTHIYNHTHAPTQIHMYMNKKQQVHEWKPQKAGNMAFTRVGAQTKKVTKCQALRLYFTSLT